MGPIFEVQVVLGTEETTSFPSFDVMKLEGHQNQNLNAELNFTTLQLELMRLKIKPSFIL